MEVSLQSRIVSLEEIQEVLYRPDPAPDEIVVNLFSRCQPSYSVLWSAGYVLGAAGFVCHLRPHLVGQILVRPLGALFTLGARSADHVLCWADPLLEARLAALADCTESIMETPRAYLVGFTWFHPMGLNPNALLKTLLKNMVEASGPEAEGVEWLRANLPRHRQLIQAILDRMARDGK
jgi:hypothetical protein